MTDLEAEFQRVDAEYQRHLKAWREFSAQRRAIMDQMKAIRMSNADKRREEYWADAYARAERALVMREGGATYAAVGLALGVKLTRARQLCGMAKRRRKMLDRQGQPF